MMVETGGTRNQFLGNHASPPMGLFTGRHVQGADDGI